MRQTKKGEAAGAASDASIPLIQLQADIGDLIDQARALVRVSVATLAKSTGKREQKKFDDLESRLLRERKNVASLELRLAVVAPMKAGKSTIINGLLGREILPFRSAAMTSLPTEVVLTPSGGEPRLLLSPEMLEAIQNAEVDLRELLQHVGRDVLAKLLGSNPDCAKVVERLRSNTTPLLSRRPIIPVSATRYSGSTISIAFARCSSRRRPSLRPSAAATWPVWRRRCRYWRAI